MFSGIAGDHSTLGSIAFGVVALILAGIYQDTIDELGESMIHSQSGHLQVSREGYREHAAETARLPMREPQALRSRLAALNGVDEVLPDWCLPAC